MKQQSASGCFNTEQTLRRAFEIADILGDVGGLIDVGYASVGVVPNHDVGGAYNTTVVELEQQKWGLGIHSCSRFTTKESHTYFSFPHR